METPPPPSTEACESLTGEATDPAYIAALFGTNDEVQVPALIAHVIEEVADPTGASRPVVAAVALATLAAAMGPKVMLRRGREHLSVPFNVIVHHDAPRSLPWFDAVTTPFLGPVFDLQAALAKQGVSRIRHDIAQRRQDFEQARRTVQPNPELLARLKAEAEAAQARLKPMVAASTVVPKELGKLLPQAFDGGMTLVAAGSDPGVDLRRLRIQEHAALVELLNRSWGGTPLGFGQHVHTGNLTLLWQTRTAAKDLLGPRGFSPDLLAVPAVFLCDGTPGVPLPEFPHEPEWQHQVGAIFEHRCTGQACVFTLHPDAEKVLAGFAAHLLATLDAVPVVLRAHIAWMPELAARLATVFRVLGGKEDVEIGAPTVTDAVEMVRWLGRQHVRTLGAVVANPDTAGGIDKKEVLLKKVRAKAPITRRELRRCFDNQRVQWFDAALDALLEEKKARYNEEGMLIPCS